VTICTDRLTPAPCAPSPSEPGFTSQLRPSRPASGSLPCAHRGWTSHLSRTSLWWVGPRESNALHESLVEGTQRAVLMCICILLCYVGSELGPMYIVNLVTNELLHHLSFGRKVHIAMKFITSCSVVTFYLPYQPPSISGGP
jgi:hypothetical protein